MRLNRIRLADGDAQGFLDRCHGSRKIAIRDRSGVKSRTLRKVDMLPPMEIREGILLAVKRNIGIKAEDCAREVSQMLDFKSLSADLRHFVSQVAMQLVAEGSLELAGEELRLS